MATRPRRKWVDNWSTYKSPDSQDALESQVWVDDIPTAPRPIKTQIQESRWANTPNPQPQQPGVKYPTTTPKGALHHVPQQANGTEKSVSAANSIKSYEKPGQAKKTSIEEPVCASSHHNVPPHLRHTVQGYLRPTTNPSNHGQSVQKGSLLTTAPLNDTAQAGQESVAKKSDEDAAEHPAPVSPCGSLVLTTRHSVIADSNDNLSHSIVPDIRRIEPVEIFEEQDWNATRRTRRNGKAWESESLDSDMAGFGPPTSLKRYVDFWLQPIPSVRADFFDIPDNEFQDVNTVTGTLLPKIEYPENRKSPDNQGVYISRLDEKLTETSAMKIRQKMLKLKRQAEKEKWKQKSRLMDQQELEFREEQARRVNPWQCRIPAHLRPATMGDMEAVAAIYNQEVQEGWRSLDEKPIGVPAWRGVLDQCKTLKLPFIVALTRYHNPHIPVGQARHQVMGFAFLDIASRGVTGSIHSTGKHSARLYVLVDPQYRRKRLGTALLDAIMSIASPSYHQKEDSYQFKNPDNDPVYFSANKNPREYRTIFIEVCVKNLGIKDDTVKGEEYQFIWNFLEGEFQTFLQSYTVSFGRCETLDPPFYLDRLIFEHQARTCAVVRHLY